MKGLDMYIAVVVCVLAIVALTYASAANGRVLHKVDTEEKVLYLTFDDGPGPYTKQVLNFLDNKQVPATFFVVGQRVTDDPDLVARMVRDGHVVGVHSYSHPFFMFNAKEELLLSSLAIESTTGVKPTLFRPPWGMLFPWTLNAANDADLKVVRWSCLPRDYSASKEEIISRVTKCFQPGAIIVLHAWNHEQTIQALPEIVSQARMQGYEFKVLE